MRRCFATALGAKPHKGIAALVAATTTLCADQIRIDHREGTTGNYTLLPLTTTPDYVLTFDAQGNPIIGPAAASVTPANPTAQIGLSAVNGTASTFMRSDAAPALDTSINPFWTGEHFFFGRVSFTDVDAYGDIYTTGNVAVVGQLDVSGNTILSKTSALNAPALSLTGSIVAGGTGVTNTPHVLIQPTTATAATDWNTRGTAIGVNTPTSFGGTMLDLRRGDGASNYSPLIKVTRGSTQMFSLRDDGILEVLSAGAFTSNLVAIGYGNTSGNGVAMASDRGIGWVSSSGANAPIAYVPDVALARLGPGNLRLGNIPSATPLAQTLTIGDASRPGTDSNTAGANGTIQSGLGTGTGAVSSLIFQTPSVAGAGSGVQTYATRLTLNETEARFPGAVVVVATAVRGVNELGFEGLTRMTSNVGDGILSLYNQALTGFNRLQLGGTTSAYPAIKRNANQIDFRLADDSDYCITSSRFCMATGGYFGFGSSVNGNGIFEMGDGVWRFAGTSGSGFNRIQLGGTDAAFPAIKRSGAALEARLADDSASTDLTVATEVYGAGWNNDNTVPTKDAVYDKIQTMGGGAATATGYKTANQLTFSGTAVNATSMSFAIAASEVWSFEFYIGIVNEAGGSSPKFALDVPTGCTVGALANSTASSSNFAVITTDATLTVGILNTTPGRVTITGLAQNGANAGTVQLMFASGDGINDTSIVGGQSYFVARKMN